MATDKETKEIELVIKTKIDPAEINKAQKEIKRLEKSLSSIADKKAQEIDSLSGIVLGGRKTKGLGRRTLNRGRLSGRKITDRDIENYQEFINKKAGININRATNRKREILDRAFWAKEIKRQDSMLAKTAMNAQKFINEKAGVRSIKAMSPKERISYKQWWEAKEAQKEKINNAKTVSNIKNEIKNRAIKQEHMSELARQGQEYWNEYSGVKTPKTYSSKERFMYEQWWSSKEAEKEKRIAKSRTNQEKYRNAREQFIKNKKDNEYKEFIKSRNDRAGEYLLSKGYSQSQIKKIQKGVNVILNKGIENTVKGRMSSLFDALKKDRPYDNAPFRRMMMYIGSGMLLQYAGFMITNSIKGLIDATAQTEMASLKSRNYRQNLMSRGISTSNFDTMVSKYSSLSGMPTYEAGGMFAGFLGSLENRGVNTSSLSPDSIVKVLRGLGSKYGDDPQKATDRLSKILSGKLSAEERKEYGVSARRNPVVILQEILETLQKDPAGRIGMDEMLLADRLRSITSAPKGTLNLIQSNFKIFSGIAKNLDNFMQGFFPQQGSQAQARWTGLAETLRIFTSKVFTKEHGESLAIGISDTLGPFIGTLNSLLDIIGKVNNATNGLVGKLVKWYVEFKIYFGVLSGISGLLLNFLGKVKDALDFMKGLGLGTKGKTIAETATKATKIGGTAGTALATAGPTVGAGLVLAGTTYGIGKGLLSLDRYKRYTDLANRYSFEGRFFSKDKYLFGRELDETQKYIEKNNMSRAQFIKENPNSLLARLESIKDGNQHTVQEYEEHYKKVGEEFIKAREAQSKTQNNITATNVFIMPSGTSMDNAINGSLVGA